MFKNIGILLWKEKAYCPWYIILIGAIIPLKSLLFVNFLTEYIEISEESLNFVEKSSESCEIVYENDILLYEPFNPFLESFMEKVACLAGFQKISELKFQFRLFPKISYYLVQ